MHETGHTPVNKVYLVGAGPGDPELLTVKAKRLLEQADCVLYDHLAGTELLRLAPVGAERVYVGKKKADHTFTQEQICALLIDRGRRGLNVVRLKGGDPYMFGRGGEEAEALSDAGLAFEVVPGVTSPLGIAAYAGVPLTHRDHTSVVTFIAGHDVGNIDWAKVGTSETLVIFMGLSQFNGIAAKLIASGRSGATPAMAVRWGTRPNQQVVVGTLETLPASIQRLGMKPPATIIVGEVVRLREKLSWFEKLPLFGITIVITRAREQAGTFASVLHGLGAEVLELPTIKIEPAADYGPLDTAIRHLPEYDWLIFTSVNGVRFFLERLSASAHDLRSIRGRICAIGPATRDALRKLHLKVDVTAERYVAEGVLEALAGYEFEGARVLLARAAVARDVIPAGLAERGAHVDVVDAYCTVAPEGLRDQALEFLRQRPDWVAFTSSSTARNLLEAVGAAALTGVRVASIGPVTSATLREYGVEPTMEAAEFTISGIVTGIIGG